MSTIKTTRDFRAWAIKTSSTCGWMDLLEGSDLALAQRTIAGSIDRLANRQPGAVVEALQKVRAWNADSTDGYSYRAIIRLSNQQWAIKYRAEAA